MKKIIMFLFIFYLILPQIYSQVSEKSKKNAKIAYNSAIENIRSLNFELALTYLDATLDLDPGFNDALIQRAKVKVELGRLQDAISDFQIVAEREPANGEPDFYIAYLQFNQDTSQIIINRLENAVTKGYKEAQVYYYIGLYNLLAKNYQSAIKNFNTSIDLKPDYSLAYHNRAEAKREMGDLQAALYDFRMAVSYDNNFPVAYNNMGSVKMALGDYKGAVNDYNTAISLDRNFYIAYNNRGTAKYYLGQPDSALIDFNQAIVIHDNYLPALNNKAACLAKNTVYPEAISLFSQVISSDNSYGKAYLNRGLVKELTGDIQGACADWRKASELGIKEAEKYLKECK